ncbi:MAG: MotA/TolQ/ExbB proton channel family protein [Planctomycetes bacterium]|nr:MotA/TolQ/ExbB proton channel family protein [Planctomycetota bacterium]
MWAIAVIAFAMLGIGVHTWLRLRALGYSDVPEDQWRTWIERPRGRAGRIGDILDFVTGGKTIKETSFFFAQLRQTEAAPFERDLKIMKICVSAAPLVGLLGTVTGMLTTFDALATGSGGDKTMAMIASGISEALVTTETGLVVALPGLYFQYYLSRNFEHYRAFLAHLETVCAQLLHRRRSADEQRAVETAAKNEIAALLQRAVS